MQLCIVCSVTCSNSGLSDLWTAVTTVTLISNCRSLPQKLIDPALLQTFPKSYGAQMFAAVFTTPHYLSLSQAHTLPSCPFKFHFNIILPPTLCSECSLSTGLSISLPFTPTRATFGPLHLATHTVFSSECKSQTFSFSYFDQTQLIVIT